MAAVPPRHVVSTTTHVPLMLALTFSTGIIDAVGYLGLDRVFTGNMTGNVVILGMALTGARRPAHRGTGRRARRLHGRSRARGPPLRDRGRRLVADAHPACSRSSPQCWRSIAVCLRVRPAPAAARWRSPSPGLLGLAMGIQAATARHVAVREVTTVVVTSTITALAAESWFGTRRGAQLPRRGSAIALIMAGAAVGALLLHWHPAAGVALSVVVSALVAFLGERDRRAAGVARRRPRRQPHEHRPSSTPRRGCSWARARSTPTRACSGRCRRRSSASTTRR